MVDSWRSPHQDPSFFSRMHIPANTNEELLAKRNRMLELYKDPDWLLQTGLADVEFEQGLYDHMAYGDKGVNKLGLDSLRHWNEYGGPLRYMDPSPGDTPFAEFSDPWFMQDEPDLGTLGFTNTRDVMDMNLNNIIETRNRGLPQVPHDINWEDTDYSTQNAINDLFTHELIHTNPRLDEFSDIEVTTPYNPPWSPDVIEHPIIYRNTAQYGANPAMVATGQRYWDKSNILKEGFGPHPRPSEWVSNYPNEWINRSKSDIADDIVRESTMYHGRSPIDERRRYPKGNYRTLSSPSSKWVDKSKGKGPDRGQQRKNTGGIASLVL
jgi:hypothetical protein